MFIKCKQCGQEKYIRIFLKDYAYKMKDKKGKLHYFCDYTCMRKAKEEHPEKWARKRDM